MAITYQVINCAGGDPRYVNYEIRSNHRTLSGAVRSFREWNRWLFDRKFAERHGLQNAGTFDRIIRLDEDGDVVDWDVIWSEENGEFIDENLALEEEDYGYAE